MVFDEALVIHWSRDDSNMIISESARFRVDKNDLVIDDVAMDDGGHYSCGDKTTTGATVSLKVIDKSM